jgi:hypothetical protein
VILLTSEVAGEEGAPIPSNGHMVNAGTIVQPANLPACQVGSGKARRQQGDGFPLPLPESSHRYAVVLGNREHRRMNYRHGQWRAGWV